MDRFLRAFVFTCGLWVMGMSVYLPEIQSVSALVTIPAMCFSIAGGAVLMAFAVDKSL